MKKKPAAAADRLKNKQKSELPKNGPSPLNNQHDDDNIDDLGPPTYQNDASRQEFLVLDNSSLLLNN